VAERKAPFSIRKKGLRLFSRSSTSLHEKRVSDGNLKESNQSLLNFLSGSQQEFIEFIERFLKKSRNP
jgi:hypothetical protein